MALHSYIPQDRRRALAQGESLPERVSGAALLADISGFTALTEALTQEQGERRGIEALSLAVNTVYETLIDAVERLGGSVIGFAGDAITCWFDAAQLPDPDPPRGAVCTGHAGLHARGAGPLGQGRRVQRGGAAPGAGSRRRAAP